MFILISGSIVSADQYNYSGKGMGYYFVTVTNNEVTVTAQIPKVFIPPDFLAVLLVSAPGPNGHKNYQLLYLMDYNPQTKKIAVPNGKYEITLVASSQFLPWKMSIDTGT